LSQRFVTFVAEKNANLHDAEVEKIVYLTMPAGIPAAFASGIVTWRQTRIPTA
jgi:hypothetical protein